MFISLSFMPGSGGNFLARCLNLHNEIDFLQICCNKSYKEKWKYLCYQSVLDRKGPFDSHWVKWEEQYSEISEDSDKKIIDLNHGCPITQMKITTTTQQEWKWSIQQALWKNTFFNIEFLLTGQKDNQEKVKVPCKNLWDFDSLSKSLVEIENYLNVKVNDPECREWQKKLWEEWKLTWAPAWCKTLLEKAWKGPKE